MHPNMLFSLYIDNIKNEFINYKYIISELENIKKLLIKEKIIIKKIMVLFMMI